MAVVRVCSIILTAATTIAVAAVGNYLRKKDHHCGCNGHGHPVSDQTMGMAVGKAGTDPLQTQRNLPRSLAVNFTGRKDWAGHPQDQDAANVPMNQFWG